MRRSAILFALGMLGTFFPFYTVVLERVRIPGVLQRIAIVYLVAAFAYRFLRPRAWVALGVFLIACYWAAMMLIPVPGFGAGDLSPEGNLAFWLDHQLLGAHTWRFSPGPGDPEGLLSTLPAIVTALIGLLAGEHLRTRNVTPGDLGRVAGIGAALAFAGLAFSPLFPINKNLWSPTYTLLTGGLALIVFAFTYWQVDLRGRVGAIRPFEIFGRNSILAFVGSGLLAKLLIVVIKVGEGENRVSLQTWLYRRLFESWLPDYVSSLAWALAMVLVWLAILAALDRRKIYLKV